MNTGKKIFLTIGVMLCLLGLSYFLYTNLNEHKSSDVTIQYQEPLRDMVTSTPGPNRIDMIQNGLLHLYAMDEKYVSLLADAASPATLDTMQRSILRTEKMLRQYVDSLYATMNVVAEQGTASFYKKMIDNRSLLRIAQVSSSTPSTNEMDPKNTRDLQMLLLKKNEEILTLQDQLATAPANGNNEGSKGDDAGLATRLKLRDQAYLELQQKYAALEQSLGSLNRRVNESMTGAKSNASNSAATQEKINDLEVALRFAQVDCNLTRVDGRAIISNNRQRSALLGESLTILNSLSENENKTVQKRAKDKLVELSHIASMVRD